jgi:hypothetical protein
MNIVLIVGAIVGTAMAIRYVLIREKRPSRKADLRHHIFMIHDPSGCAHAGDHLRQARHIMEHYGIDLAEVGFNGDYHALQRECERSMQRAHARRMSLAC